MEVTYDLLSYKHFKQVLHAKACHLLEFHMAFPKYHTLEYIL